MKIGANRIRPSRYASQLNWGTRHLRGRHYLERALSQSQHQFADTLAASIKSQLPMMFGGIAAYIPVYMIREVICRQ